ncbi:MAG: GSU2403 family nucleotidyltransferase fold protein [Deltaproteobacteria bacterium]|nr:GSU2403 family nucleotidyltransferase fold protein [Deltaproteobacteria bacterium]
MEVLMTIRLPVEMEEPLRDLGACLVALGPYLDRAVLAGGMVPVIYRHLESVREVDRIPLTTFDMDIAVPGRLGRGGHPLVAELLDKAAFEMRLRGSDDPPVAIYQHSRHGRDGIDPIHIEFLAPLTGPETDRAGEQRRLVQVQHGLQAQALRYVGLLLEHPLAVHSARVPALRIPDPGVEFHVPHPAMFILQKMLCRDERPADKRDKDLAYVFDVVTIFTPMWAEIGAVARDVASGNATQAAWIENAKKKLTALFSSPTADGSISVRRVYAGSGSPAVPSEDGVFRVIGRFLDESGLRADR